MSELIVQGKAPAGFWCRLRGPTQRLRSLFVYLSFSAAANAIGLVTTLFMVHYVAPREMGRVALVVGALMVTNTLISFGADNLIAINRTNLDAQAYRDFRASYSHFALLNFAVWQVVTVFVWVTFHVDNLVLLVPLMSLTKFFVTMAGIEYMMEQRAFAYGLVQCFTSLAATLVTVVLVLLVSPKAESRIARPAARRHCASGCSLWHTATRGRVLAFQPRDFSLYCSLRRSAHAVRRPRLCAE